jgi:hypothetical protein
MVQRQAGQPAYSLDHQGCARAKMTSLIDADSIALVREFIRVYGQEAYERLCDKFAGQPDEALISTMKRAFYGDAQA